MKLGQKTEMESVYPIYPEQSDPEPEHKPGRPVLILGLIALLELVLVVVLLVLCMPYFQQEDDPQAVTRLEHLMIEETEPIEEIHPPEEETEPENDPTIPPEANPYTVKDFQYNKNNYLYCLRQTSYEGVDVSAFQGDIDWQKVKDSGIDFAIIRLGYRGYGKAGRLVEDEYVQDNLKEATEVGLTICAYFFSQALNIVEVDE